MEKLPGDKTYKCSVCGKEYTEEDADILDFMCCDEEMIDLEASPESSDDSVPDVE